jgi:hypothetical protein
MGRMGGRGGTKKRGPSGPTFPFLPYLLYLRIYFRPQKGQSCCWSISHLFHQCEFISFLYLTSMWFCRVEFRTPNQKCHLTIIIYLFNNNYTCVIRFSKVRIHNQQSRQEQKMKKCVEVRTPIVKWKRSSFWNIKKTWVCTIMYSSIKNTSGKY